MISSNLDCCSVHKRNALLNTAASVLFAFFFFYALIFVYCPFLCIQNEPIFDWISWKDQFDGAQLQIVHRILSALLEMIIQTWERCIIPALPLKSNGNKNLANMYLNAQIVDVIQYEHEIKDC